MVVNQYKVAILFYMLIVMQEQPEFNQDHNHEHHHKHPHDHDHDHHRRSQIRKASRIYNGVRTPPGQAKFMAVMVKRRRGNHCSAVIITGDMLLTAAHCLKNESSVDLRIMRIVPSAFSMQTFRNDPHSRDPLIKRIRNFWIHPRYNPNIPLKIYDIAIIQIGPHPWRLGQEVDTALMPVRTRRLDLTMIKGYGFGLEVGELSTGYLNEVNFHYYWNQTYCEEVRKLPRSNDTDTIFCVTNWSADRRRNPRTFRNFAPGDSGGGIFIKGTVERWDRSTGRIVQKTGMVLAGIAARANNYSKAIANLNRPYGVTAFNVTTMMPWINSVVMVDFVKYPFPILSEEYDKNLRKQQ